MSLTIGWGVLGPKASRCQRMGQGERSQKIEMEAEQSAEEKRMEIGLVQVEENT